MARAGARRRLQRQRARACLDAARARPSARAARQPSSHARATGAAAEQRQSSSEFLRRNFNARASLVQGAAGSAAVRKVQRGAGPATHLPPTIDAASRPRRKNTVPQGLRRRDIAARCRPSAPRRRPRGARRLRRSRPGSFAVEGVADQAWGDLSCELVRPAAVSSRRKRDGKNRHREASSGATRIQHCEHAR